MRRVRAVVPARLWRAFLFGSRARGDARPDSDVDVLLVWHRLPPDREPQARIAEWVAEEVAERSGVPVTCWSVSRVDLLPGNRTPMLVDALDDGIPLWPAGAPPLRVPFTPADALGCVGSLLRRVEEGSDDVGRHLLRGEVGEAARRTRDDLVRMATAALLLVGETRPRRAETLRRLHARLVRRGEMAPLDPAVARWAASSYGPAGKDDEQPVALPPVGLSAAAREVDRLRCWVRGRAARLAAGGR